jgi:hypothetical protein
MFLKSKQPMPKINYTSLAGAIAMAFIAMISSSCVNNKTLALSSTDRVVMKGKTVAVIQRGMPEYGVIKPSAVLTASLTGPIGAVFLEDKLAKEGALELYKHHVVNPDETVSGAVTKSLVSKVGVKSVPGSRNKHSLDPKVIASENRHADYALDCCTLGWMGSYYPLRLHSYWISYTAKMQLIETSTGRVVASGYSHYQGNDPKNAPNYDGIYSNDAAFLKAETKKGADQAIGEFTKSF